MFSGIASHGCITVILGDGRPNELGYQWLSPSMEESITGSSGCDIRNAMPDPASNGMSVTYVDMKCSSVNMSLFNDEMSAFRNPLHIFKT